MANSLASPMLYFLVSVVSETPLFTYRVSESKNTKFKNSCSSFGFQLLLIIFVSGGEVLNWKKSVRHLGAWGYGWGNRAPWEASRDFH